MRATERQGLFALPQDQVHEAADEGEGEGHPGQDEGVAVRAFCGQSIEILVVAVNVLASVCVNGSCNHDTQAWEKKSEDTNKSRAAACPRPLRGLLETNLSFYY